jgi:hypothetical protein
VTFGEPESEGYNLTNMGTARTFDLPEGWSLRKVATAMAREWLPPFRAEPVAKGAPWLVQPIMEETTDIEGPLWEAGISTEEYENRLDRPSLNWAVRAKSSRGKTSKAVILARFSTDENDPGKFQMVCTQDAFPEALFDQEKLATFFTDHGEAGVDGLFAGLLAENGFQLTSV